MKKILLLIVSVSLVAALLSGCMLLKTAVPSGSAYAPALGLKPLPSGFLNWWFDRLKSRQSGSVSEQGKEPLKSVATWNEISDTQRLLVQPTSQNPTPPSSYDLRDYDVVPSVGDQGMVNDCWAYSTVESLESAMLVQLGLYGISEAYPFISDPSSPDLSVQFAAYNDYDFDVAQSSYNGYDLTYSESNRDSGGNHFFSFYDLFEKGVPLSSDFPYDANESSSYVLPYIQWNPTNGSWPQHLVKINYAIVIPSAEWFYDNGYGYSDYIDTIKSAVMTYGAVAVDLDVYKDFENDTGEPSGWVYPGPSESTNEGGHAVILIGWDDDWTYNGTDYGPVWLLQNQWGTYWGDGGYWRQPMVTEQQYDDPQTIGNWQIESNSGGMYAPVL